MEGLTIILLYLISFVGAATGIAGFLMAFRSEAFTKNAQKIKKIKKIGWVILSILIIIFIIGFIFMIYILWEGFQHGG